MRINSRVVVRISAISLVFAAACGEPPPTQPASTQPPTPAPPAVAARPAPALARPAARSFHFSDGPAKQEIAAETPLSLTASDGTGLKLVALRANGVVLDPLAFTELRMTFENPEDRELEGRFHITLPQGASISRFAMKIDGRWQEGEVVELEAARRAYEDFLHRKQDPALLEQGAGNSFDARVFPIPARGRKEIVLSYSHELAGLEEPYRIPLRGLPELGQLDVRVVVDDGSGAGRRVVEESFARYVPDHDFEVAAPRTRGRVGLRSGDLVVARVTPELPSEPDEIGSLVVLVDTSASRALGFSGEVALVERLVSGLAAGGGPDVPIAVAAFDQDVALIYEGPAGGFGPAEARRLADHGALGASDLGGALAWVARRAPGRYRRVVVVTDGVSTAGPTEGDPLGEASRGLAAAGVERIDAVALGGIRDENALARVVTAGLARDGVVVDGDEGVSSIAGKLTRSARSGIAVTVEGAEWVAPARLDGVQAGDSVLVYAQLAGDRAFALSLSGKPVAIESQALAPVERPLLARAAARARIGAILEERETAATREARAALEQEIVTLSVRHRVLTPLTALLVLETEADYRRFRIDRNALADILTVGGDGITVVDRATETVTAPSKGKRRPRPDASRTADRASAPGGGDVGGEEEGGEDKKMKSAEDERIGSPGGAPAMRGAASAAPPESAPRAPRPSRDFEQDDRPAPRAERPGDPLARPEPRDDPGPAKEPRVSPYTGRFKQVMNLLGKKKADEALARARAWHAESPGDVMALVALGEALEKRGDIATAARAYGSLIDLFPARADLRRFAGQRLERLRSEEALALAVDTYAKAVAQRPDHPASHRLYGFALLRAGRHEAAFDAIAAGLKQKYPEDRFAGAREILAEDLGLVAEAWMKVDPDHAKEIRARLRKAGGVREDRPSLRFVLYWETDANDVDFHIYDGAGDHAFYSDPELASGGRLYADVTTGYGPECFTIRGKRSGRSYPYKLQAHYYSRGPMGYGMGKLEIIEHDGNGGLTFEERPFVVMQDGAFLDLGTVKRK